MSLTPEETEAALHLLLAPKGSASTSPTWYANPATGFAAKEATVPAAIANCLPVNR